MTARICARVRLYVRDVCVRARKPVCTLGEHRLNIMDGLGEYIHCANYTCRFLRLYLWERLMMTDCLLILRVSTGAFYVTPLNSE